MNNIALNQSFEDVECIIKAYNEEIQSTGEGYNVFNILGLTYNEVRTHTAFLADLLNPKGTHGKGDVFLKIFIEQISSKHPNWKLNDFCQDGNINVKKESSIGTIDENYHTGGNIDILLTNLNAQAIIIENKINAGDQKNQLLRYHNYGKRYANNGFELLYLTLEGRAASDDSKGGVLDENDYKRISYSEDINAWLEKCISHSNTHLLLNSTILQYTYLVKLLTGNTKYNVMEEDIRGQIIKSETTFLTAKAISEQYNNITTVLIPESARKAINNKWKENFDSGENNRILVFTFNDYEIYISISEEYKWHTQIWPVKRVNNEEVFGVAHDDCLSFLYSAIDPINGYSTFKNHNYTIWFYSNNGINSLTIDEKLSLLDIDEANNWAMLLIDEADSILNYFITGILKLPAQFQNEIKWNVENTKVQTILNSVRKENLNVPNENVLPSRILLKGRYLLNSQKLL